MSFLRADKDSHISHFTCDTMISVKYVVHRQTSFKKAPFGRTGAFSVAFWDRLGYPKSREKRGVENVKRMHRMDRVCG